MHRFVGCMLLALVMVLGVGRPAAAAPAPGVPPVAGPVVRGFSPPEVPWGSGHRGIDIAAEPGAVVVAPVAGVVTFAGIIAGRPVLVITHGATRTTLEPVSASVPTGAAVSAGQMVGLLSPGHRCDAPACLHWGLRRGEQYLDPLSLLAVSEVRLLPTGAAELIRARAHERERVSRQHGPLPPDGGGVLARPSVGRLTSGFGMRWHPIFKEWRLHAGIDLSAPCGTPLQAAADGTVAHMGFDNSGGWRLVIDHGALAGLRVQTVYLHAQGYTVRRGERVSRGQRVGSMGSTGWSTGCHLHFSVKVAGRHVDPLRWLG